METSLPRLDDVSNNKLLISRQRHLSEDCYHCEIPFNEKEQKIIFENRQWHKKCFVCAQCLQELEVDLVFTVDHRNYCKHDYKILFAPNCKQCNEFILQGRVLKALDGNWHADCFRCASCDKPLADSNSFKKNKQKPYCSTCYENIKFSGYTCFKCNSKIREQEGYLKSYGEIYHTYHFKCRGCNCELDKNYREKDKEFYCLRCFDKTGPICGTCRRPIEERVIYALGKTYHVQHFVCGFCDKPFLGTHYFVYNGVPYCELHYEMMNCKRCSYCQKELGMDLVEFLNKYYCVKHFCCFACDFQFNAKDVIFKIDRKPICKLCIEKLPKHLRKRLAQLHKKEEKMPANKGK